MCAHELLLSKGHLLATAFSNVATDHLANALRSSGLNVVRVGTGGRVDQRDITLQYLMEQHVLWKKRVQIQNQIDEMKKEEKKERESASAGSVAPMASRSRFAELKKKRDDLDGEIINSVICEADVVCATCAGVGHPLLANQRFSVVLVRYLL